MSDYPDDRESRRRIECLYVDTVHLYMWLTTFSAEGKLSSADMHSTDGAPVIVLTCFS